MRIPIMLFVIAFATCFVRVASADTFTSYVAFTSSGGIDNVGFSADADQLVAVTGSCPSFVGICWLTFDPITGSRTTSTTEPALGFVPSGPNSPFVTSTPVGSDGLETLSLTYFSSTDHAFETVDVFTGIYNQVFVDSNNDVAFVNTRTDQNILFYDETTHSTSAAISPEPSSFLLLGTGLLGMAGAVKRRFA